MDEETSEKGVDAMEEVEQGEAGKSNREQLQQQVTAFTTRAELGRHASKLQLSRIPLAELQPGSLLTDTYVGGKVISIFSAHLTQGSVVILLQDNPKSDKYAQCVVSGDVTRLLPCATQLGTSEVYVHGVMVEATTAECSQELDVELRVSGEEGNIWIVNREAGSVNFLPARQPSEFHGRGGNAKKAKRQRHMKAGLERGMKMHKASSSSVDPPPPDPQSTTSSSSTIKEPTPQSVPAQSITATHYAPGPSPPPSYSPKSVPTLPDAKQGPEKDSTAESTTHDPNQMQTANDAREAVESHEQLDNNEEDNSSENEGTPSDESQSTSNDNDRTDGRQDKTLFPYQTTTRSAYGYTYRKVAELEAGLQKANVFGVVVDFQPPFQTKGRDICSIVNIIDESVIGDQSFKCTFFHQNKEKLPIVSKVGEIVCFHRINIKLFPNGIQAIGQSFTSSLSFSGRLGARVKPITGSVSYTFTSGDKKRVKELRLWNAKRSRVVDPLLRPLKDISVSSTSSNVVCQILSISLQELSSDSHTAVLGVWDGTQTQHRSLALDLSSFNTTTVTDSSLIRVSDSYSENVVVHGRALVSKLASIHPGQFVCLQNIQAKEHAGQFNSFKDEFTAVELRLQPAAVDDEIGREADIKVSHSNLIEVFELKKSLKKFTRKQMLSFRPIPPDIKASPITETQHTQQQPIPLGSLKQFIDVPTKFMCVVKVLGIKPGSVEEMVQLRCPNCRHKKATTSLNAADDMLCTNCSTGDQQRSQEPMEFVYFFKLKLADETGHIEAYVSGQQAANFLADFPPVAFSQHPQQRMALIHKLYTLTGGNDPFDLDSVTFTRPWVAVCIISMHTNGLTSEALSSCNTSYHLFDTTLKNNIL